MKKRLPFGLDVQGLWEWAWRVAALLLIIASFYLNTVYETKADTVLLVARIDSVEKKYAELPAEVAATTQNLRAHIQSDAEMNKSLVQIQSELSGMRATQRESMKNIETNFNRVFNKLDQLPAR